jgi:hypothetical protein
MLVSPVRLQSASVAGSSTSMPETPEYACSKRVLRRFWRLVTSYATTWNASDSSEVCVSSTVSRASRVGAWGIPWMSEPSSPAEDAGESDTKGGLPLDLLPYG